MAKYLALIELDDLREKVKESKFISLSIDKVTSIDNTSWFCIHIYTFIDSKGWAHLLKLVKMVESYNVKNLYNLIIKSLNEIALLHEIEIKRKLICAGADSTIIMQDHKNDLCAKL